MTRIAPKKKERPTASPNRLAIFGGKKSVQEVPSSLFDWPIITSEDERAVLNALRARKMSGTDITQEFEKKWAAWQGSKYALGFNNGTASLQAAMFGCKVGVGDEVICPSVTYWASVIQCLSLGATPVFAEIDPKTLCIDPKQIEGKITPQTKAIVVVHYLSHPAEMNEIMKIARRHKIKVIEDVSHAEGGLYQGKRLGTIGDVAGMSMMTGKSFAIGEAGMLTTDDREIYDRAIAFGHYERYRSDLPTESLRPYAGLPLGGYKHRMHQLSSAMGLVQLKQYDKRCAEIRKAMNYFWDLLKDVPGLRPHRVDEKSGSNMGGWYAAHGHYLPEELGGLSITRFCEAVRAEGVTGVSPGCNLPLHTHPMMHQADIYNHGKPTRIANSHRDVREKQGSLPISETIGARTIGIPWFKHFRPRLIKQHADAFRKVALQASELIKDDPGNPTTLGGWHFFTHR